MHRINRKKFKIERVYWHEGDIYSPPGYRVMITINDGKMYHEALIGAGQEVNPDWIISMKEIESDDS